MQSKDLVRPIMLLEKGIIERYLQTPADETD